MAIMMNSKKWTIAFVSLIILVLAGIMALNYFVDPYKYFSSQNGDYYEVNDRDYLRELKAEHIKHFGNQYDAYLVSGSKGGALHVDKLKELDGNNYYNCWILSGNFVDYEAYIKFILENTDAKKILFQISTSELKDFSRESYGDIYEIPAVITGKSKLAEHVKFLMKNPSVAWEKLTGEEVEDYPCFPTGERNLKKYYNFFNQNIGNGTTDDNAYYKRMLKTSKKYLKYMDRDAPEKPGTVNNCVDAMREIKKACDKKGVELKVFYAPNFAAQMMQYEGDSFYELLEQSVMIFGDVWCFSGFDKLSLCPYNFYNPSHFFYEMGDLMIDTMAGKDTGYDDFGVLLTRENVGAEIEKRRKKMAEWKAYYAKNGTLPYEGINSSYNLKKTYG